MKFLNSPVFNENEQMGILFKWLEQNLIDENKLKRLTKEKTWKELFGQTKYNDNQLRRNFSELNRLAMQFLAFEEYQKNLATEALFLLPAINESRLRKHFVGAVRQMKDQLDKDGHLNSNYQFLSYHIESQNHFHLERSIVNKKGLEHIRKADFHLDCFYIINKLRHYVELLMWKNVRSISTDLDLFPDFLNYVATSKFIEVPTIAVYYNILMVYRHPGEEERFYNFRKLLDKNSKYFNKTELHNIYLTAQNYCAYQINQGNLKYYKELFKLYQNLLKKGLLLSKGVLAQGNYKNIITVGLMVDEPKWVESFIEEYSDRLPKANQDNDRNYNLAKLYFHEKKYDQVISQLREVEYKNLVYALGGKLMLLKTYYELKEVNALDSLIDSFRIYLHRNKMISRDVRQQYMNVLRFVRKLPMEKTYDKALVEKLAQQIGNCKALAAKQWLLEKVEALK
ncbi:MAG: hypothetical protein AB8F74_15350 [Saprospiraceae bacterium]